MIEIREKNEKSFIELQGLLTAASLFPQPF